MNGWEIFFLALAHVGLMGIFLWVRSITWAIYKREKWCRFWGKPYLENEAGLEQRIARLEAKIAMLKAVTNEVVDFVYEKDRQDEEGGEEYLPGQNE